MQKPNSIIVLLCIQNQKTCNHAKLIRTTFFKCSLHAAMFLKQLRDSTQLSRKS